MIVALKIKSACNRKYLSVTIVNSVSSPLLELYSVLVPMCMVRYGKQHLRGISLVVVEFPLPPLRL